MYKSFLSVMVTCAIPMLSVVKACISTIRFLNADAPMPAHAITILLPLQTMALVPIRKRGTHAMVHA